MKMGFEPGPQVTTEPFGKPCLVSCCGREVRVRSQAEARFARELELAYRAGELLIWAYEPHSFEYEYNWRGHPCAGTYTPDFRAQWCTEGEVYYEVKAGHLSQKAANKLRHVAQQYPELKIVLVWVGRLPKRGKTKKYFDKAKKFVHHVWELKR